jgi:hypothetical protein
MRYFNILALSLTAQLLLAGPGEATRPQGRGFITTGAAVKALVTAANADDVNALIEILGPASKEILTTSDPVADRQIRRKFAARAAVKTKLIADPADPRTKTLLVGRDEWPLPIPIVQIEGKWYFDLEQGKKEILARRIGGNELDAIEVCRGYVEAQNDYAEEDRTGSGVRHYAQKIVSSPGRKDGLFWTSSTNDSPLSAIVAKAFVEGYTSREDPYHGYYFRILTAQGPQASGGEMSYLHDGLLINGFALIAWPADYGSTGIMTFLVDKTGIVYQKDLGAKTAEIAGGFEAYNPDATWTPVLTTAVK